MKLCRIRGLNPNEVIQAACPEIENDKNVYMWESVVGEIRRAVEVQEAIEFAKGL